MSDSDLDGSDLNSTRHHVLNSARYQVWLTTLQPLRRPSMNQRSGLSLSEPHSRPISWFSSQRHTKTFAPLLGRKVHDKSTVRRRRCRRHVRFCCNPGLRRLRQGPRDSTRCLRRPTAALPPALPQALQRNLRRRRLLLHRAMRGRPPAPSPPLRRLPRKGVERFPCRSRLVISPFRRSPTGESSSNEMNHI